MNLDAFLPFVLPSAKGCPDHVAAFAIRNAIIELCRGALVWVDSQPPIASVAGLQTYDFSMGAQQQAVKLLAVKVNHLSLQIVEPSHGQALLDVGSSESFAFGQSSRFTVNPTFTDDLPIVTRCAVCPTLDAEIVPDDLARFAEQIATGALSKLLATPDRDYTDAGGAALRRGMWDMHIATARSESQRGFARAYGRTRIRWF